jgi:hypothetical protein
MLHGYGKIKGISMHDIASCKNWHYILNLIQKKKERERHTKNLL